MAIVASPSNDPDPFDLGVHTPAKLARGARAALLLRSSSAIANSPIGVTARIGRVSHTPSSPLLTTSYAATTEGDQRQPRYITPDNVVQPEPVSVLQRANRLEREKVDAYEAKAAHLRKL